MTIRILSYGLSLFILWLLMSGIYQPLIIGFGLISSLLCVWILARLNILGTHGVSGDIGLFKFAKYLFWLTVEIGKADWAVTKVILSAQPPVKQRLLIVPAKQKSDFAKMLFANSITITPGTITVETMEDEFIVHSLTDEAANHSALAEMSGKVCAIEHQSAGGN